MADITISRADALRLKEAMVSDSWSWPVLQAVKRFQEAIDANEIRPEGSSNPDSPTLRGPVQ